MRARTLLQSQDRNIHFSDDFRRQTLKLPLRGRSYFNLIGHSLQTECLTKCAVSNSLARSGQRFLNGFVVELILNLPE